MDVYSTIIVYFSSIIRSLVFCLDCISSVILVERVSSTITVAERKIDCKNNSLVIIKVHTGGEQFQRMLFFLSLCSSFE